MEQMVFSRVKRERHVFLVLGSSLLMFLLAEPASHAVPPVERMVLPNQLVLLIAEEHSLPFVTLELLVDAGAWRDPPSKAGLANLTAESLLLGTRERTVLDLNEILDYMGTSIDISCERDYVSLSLKSLKREFEKGLDILIEILTQPAFPEVEVKREKDNILGGIESQKADPMELARKRFRETLFVTGPYAQPVEGTEETLPELSREMVLDFYRTYYQPGVTILTVVGDITVQEVRERVVPLVSGWEGREVPETDPVTDVVDGPEKSLVDSPITQANIVLGHGGIRRSNPDFYAVSVMNRILGGGGFSSRLLESIRVRRGLAYSVYSAFLASRFPGSFQIILQTKNSSASEAIKLALEEMERMRREPVSEQELETAKKYMIGSFPLRLNTQSRLASFISRVEYYDLGLDYPERYPELIRSVTREDVLGAARKYLHPEKCVLSVVGDLEEIGTVPP